MCRGMSHPYTTSEDYPKKFREWFNRVGATFEYDSLADKLYIICRSDAAPLTNSERYDLLRYLVMYKHAFKKVMIKEE